jgi:hypothetical protein
MIWSNLDALVAFARRRALRGLYDGRVSDNSMMLMQACSHHYEQRLHDRAATILLTRDIGHHTAGWWKNPDYERCWHLSLSQRDPATWQTVPTEHPFFAALADAFFGRDARLTWLEGPYSPEGKMRDVWHYRLFCNEAWEPILPRGEVYSKAFTEIGWRSFSEIHGTPLADVDAPFLQEGAR